METHIQNQFRSDMFIKEACQNKYVFALKNTEGFVTCESNLEIDGAEPPPSVFCIWSSEVLAKAAKKAHWESAQLFKIPLEEFMEAWCIGMEEDGYLAGINFNANLFGQELFGYDLILELLDACEKEGIILELNRFESIETFREAILAACK